MTAHAVAPELTVLHRIPSGSNAVYRCVDAAGEHWVYKPSAGERPLFDFPDGTLAAREVAAYEVSAALGWDLVPETVAAVGPGGPGMAQRWITEPAAEGRGEHDPVDVHPLGDVPEDRVAILRGEGADGADVVVAHGVADRIRRIALLDLVINNADRKGGHLLPDSEGVIWGIDHGLAFHVEPKIRTVLWGWAGEPVPPEDLEGLDRVVRGLATGGGLGDRLSALLDPDEVAAVHARAAALNADATFPVPGAGYPLPWPLF